MVHSRQDVLRIKLLADEMGIGKTATPEQVDVLNHLQLTPTVRIGDVGSQLSAGLPFTERVLAARQGERMTDAERQEALQVEANLKPDEPSWTKKANLITDQVGRSLTQMDAQAPQIGRFLDQVMSDPQSIKEEYGFSTIPKQITQAAESRAAGHAEPWLRPQPDQATVTDVKNALQANVDALQKAYKPYARKEYQRYMGSYAERQAYPAGLLAYLFAHNKDVALSEKSSH